MAVVHCDLTHTLMLELAEVGLWWVGAAVVAVLVILIGSGVTAYVIVYPVRYPFRCLPAGPPPDGLLRLDPVNFPNDDGIMLSGWHAGGGRYDVTIIACHGWPGDKRDMLNVARALVRAGFNVLTFDFRRWGASGPGPVTLGYKEALDILSAMRFLKQCYPAQCRRIGIVGRSMGAVAALLAGAQCADIEAVVADSSYCDLDLEVQRIFRRLWGPFGHIIYHPMRWFGERLIGITFSAVSPRRVIQRISPRPVLIIHGTHDRLIHVRDAHELYHAAGEPKALWLVREASHARTHIVGGAEYSCRVAQFFHQHLIEDHVMSAIGRL